MFHRTAADPEPVTARAFPMVHGIDDHADLAFLDIIQKVRTVLANLAAVSTVMPLLRRKFAVPSVAAIV